MRKHLAAAAFVALFAFAGAPSVAQTGGKQLRIIVPFPPGGTADILTRLVGQEAVKALGQTLLVENRPGGGTTVGTAQVQKSDPDGYTILVHSNAIVTVPAIQANVPYYPVKDFSGITPLGNVPLVLVIAPSKGIKNVKELVAKAKAKPGELNYGAAGIGTPPHLAMERFRLAAGFEGQLVPFKGAPEALTEVMTGRIDIYFCPITPALPLIRDGKLLALAVSSSNRASALPDVPTTIEAGVADSDLDFWVGAFVPKKTPRDVVAKMQSEIVKAIRNPATKDKLKTLGVEEMVMTPDAFDARIAKDAKAKKIADIAHVDGVTPAADNSGAAQVAVSEVAPNFADTAKVSWPMAILILSIMMIYVTMVYGPIAAFLVELFPTKIRYTSMSLPYHIGNGWFGGMLPLLATAMVASAGNGQARVTWGPAPPNGSPVLKYVVEGDGKTHDVGLQRSVDITGLTNGTAYTFTVYAVNAKGAGPKRAANPVVPTSAVPDPPTAVTAQANPDGTVTVNWPPANGQGHPVVRYDVTAISTGAQDPIGQNAGANLVIDRVQLWLGQLRASAERHRAAPHKT